MPAGELISARNKAPSSLAPNLQWTGNVNSAASSPTQFTVAVADAMEAHNAVYLNCGVLNGNITDQAIVIRDTADGIAGVLTGFDNSTYVSEKAGTANRELPEHMLFRSILSLECAEAPRTHLDDDSASEKRCCMGNTGFLYGGIVGKMRRDPLRSFAIELHKALFLHEGCSGAYQRYDLHFNVSGPGPLVLRNEFEDQIVARLLLVVAKHRRAVLLTTSKENLFEEI
ncbi:hypothetical protein IWW47_003319 [Coemansia sp. RSA 2052]|nr:hypothetical protein IWW47_003319 [Coemansia sp. RSA 2052]